MQEVAQAEQIDSPPLHQPREREGKEEGDFSAPN